jgi:hypothetical protein
MVNIDMIRRHLPDATQISLYMTPTYIFFPFVWCVNVMVLDEISSRPMPYHVFGGTIGIHVSLHVARSHMTPSFFRELEST